MCFTFDKIVSTSKVKCESCGTSILETTYELTEGFCMPCAQRRYDDGLPVSDYVKKRWPKPILSFSKLPDDVILAVAFSPGWGDEGACWVVHILEEGILRQTVQRLPLNRDNIEEELDFVILEEEQITHLRGLLAQCGKVDFNALRDKVCVEDSLDISLKGQLGSFRVTLSAYLNIAVEDGSITLTDSELEAYQLFNDVYGFVTTHCKTDWSNK